MSEAGHGTAAPAPDAPAIRALLVDDDPLIRTLLAHLLAGRGYEVDEAVDGQEALDKLSRRPANLVVTDRHMPRMDGLALCRALRARPAAGYVYCVMLTSADDEGSLVEAMDAGVDDFIAKPLRPAELGARLRAAERVLRLESGLAASNRQLADAYGQLSRDLELARSVQRGQLPAAAAFGGLHLDGLYEPCSYVGGDLYDFFPVGPRHLAFYVADVCGHGVAAAMLAAGARHQLREGTQRLLGVLERDGATCSAVAAAVVADCNRRFLEHGDPSHYLTLVSVS